MGEDSKKLDMINKFCIEQMPISDKEMRKGDQYHEGIWLICSKIHGFITRTIETGKNELDLVKGSN